MIRRIISVSIQGSTILITVAAGSNDGVRKDWKVWLVRGDREDPLPDGEVEVIRVEKTVTVGKVHLAHGEFRGNRRALLRP